MLVLSDNLILCGIVMDCICTHCGFSISCGLSWNSWLPGNHEFPCPTNYKFYIGMYADFGKTMKSNINEKDNFPQSMKIGSHKYQWIHSTQILTLRSLVKINVFISIIAFSAFYPVCFIHGAILKLESYIYL